MGYLIAIALGYLMGSSNLAYYIARLKKVDIRAGGSGNLGASNATVLMGWKVGIMVTIHDVAKAMVAVILARWLFPELAHVGAATGVAAVLGHIFPFYLKFRGGKGFACYIGMLIALNWKLAAVIILVAVVLTVITDYIVTATTTTIVAAPVYFFFQAWPAALIMLIATAVMLYKHRDNYVRIFKGTELGLRGAIRGDNRVK